MNQMITRACEHENFSASVRVNRLSLRDGGPITGFNCEIQICCAECGMKMRFRGLPFGSSPHHPTLSVDATELRAPLEAEIISELLGRPEGPVGNA